VRRIILLIMVAAVMAVAAVALPGVAFAQTPPQANPSCFGVIASSDTTTGGPGNVVGELASALGQTGTTDDVASTLVPVVQRDRPCPLTPEDLRTLIP
jgi:hypothetical protein